MPGEPPRVDRRTALALFAGAAGGIASFGAAADDADFQAFRDEVLAVLREAYPQAGFSPGDRPDQLKFGAVNHSVSHLYPGVRLLDAPDRKQKIIKWGGEIIAFEPERQREVGLARDWTTAQSLLRPQLFGSHELAVFKEFSLVLRPFADGVSIAYAMDFGKSHLGYVNEKIAAKWGQSEAQLHDRAMANLKALAEDVPLLRQRCPGGTGYVVNVKTMDGFDATRILSPRFRERLVDLLGPGPLAGIPNRNFFSAWSADCSDKARYIADMRRNSQTQMFDLTSQIFAISKDEVRPATQDELGR